MCSFLSAHIRYHLFFIGDIIVGNCHRLSAYWALHKQWFRVVIIKAKSLGLIKSPWSPVFQQHTHGTNKNKKNRSATPGTNNVKISSCCLAGGFCVFLCVGVWVGNISPCQEEGCISRAGWNFPHDTQTNSFTPVDILNKYMANSQHCAQSKTLNISTKPRNIYWNKYSLR